MLVSPCGQQRNRLARHHVLPRNLALLHYHFDSETRFRRTLYLLTATRSAGIGGRPDAKTNDAATLDAAKETQ